MRRDYLVVSIGTDQQQVLSHPAAVSRSSIKIQRRGVEPLQIVEEQGERMFRPREYADESAEHQLKTALRFLRRKFRDRRLLADDELQFRDEIDHELSVRVQRLAQRVAPSAQLFFALTQEWTDEALKGLRERRIRNVSLVLVELARRKKTSGRNERLVEFIDDGGFADAGVSGHEHQLGLAAGHDAVEGR